VGGAGACARGDRRRQGARGRGEGGGQGGQARGQEEVRGGGSRVVFVSACASCVLLSIVTRSLSLSSSRLLTLKKMWIRIDGDYDDVGAGAGSLKQKKKSATAGTPSRSG